MGLLANIFRRRAKQSVVEVGVKRLVPVAGAWTVSDRDALRQLLFSPFGKKLMQRLGATEYVLATRNAQDKQNTVHSAGVTQGYGDCIRHIISLSQSAGAQAENQNDSGAPGEARPIEREATEWEARMSP
jgi:hypothetical protein